MKNVNQDIFASFADAQMSKEEMKMVKGGAEDEVTGQVYCGTLNSDVRVGETRTLYYNGARVFGKVLSFDSKTQQGCFELL